MNKENYTLFLRTMISIFLLILFIFLMIIFIKTKENIKPGINIIEEKKIPEIKEEYISTNLIDYRKYNGSIQYDKISDEIRLYSKNNSYTIIGDKNELYSDEIKPDQNIYNNHNIYTDNFTGNLYYINDNNIKSELYENITPLIYIEDNKNKCDYFLLEKVFDNNNEFYLLNLKNDELIILNDEIVEVKLENNINNKYLIVKDKNNLYGIINYKGEYVASLSYQNIIYTISNDLFIAKYNNKYGLITYNNQTKLKFNYDFIDVYDNYITTINNNKLSVYTRKYNLSADNIDIYIEDKECFYNHECMDEYSVENVDNNLYIKLLNNKNDYDYTNYLITRKGVSVELKGNIKKIDNRFYYTDELANGKIDIKIYDDNYIEYFTYSIPCEYGKYDIEISKVNDRYYEIYIKYLMKDKEIEKLYYLDLYNSKETNELTALYKYFDNGYGYVLDRLGNLSIYKNNELISNYEKISGYIDNYYFYNSNDNKSVIYELQFKTSKK